MYDVTTTKTSPTKRTLDALRAGGYTCQVVEQWNSYARQRVDLFGGIDIVAVGHGHILGVQCTTVSNQSARIAKLRAEPRIKAWLDNGGRLQCWGWAKKLSSGRDSRKTWQATITELEAA